MKSNSNNNPDTDHDGSFHSTRWAGHPKATPSRRSRLFEAGGGLPLSPSRSGPKPLHQGVEVLGNLRELVGTGRIELET